MEARRSVRSRNSGPDSSVNISPALISSESHVSASVFQFEIEYKHSLTFRVRRYVVMATIVSDIAIFVLKRDVKLQLTN